MTIHIFAYTEVKKEERATAGEGLILRKGLISTV
jgi:hypothetical protein